jgi:protein phosphatase
MGAHAAGELASQIAVEIIPLTYQKLEEDNPSDALRKAVLEANIHIHERGQANRDFRGMGTTGSVLALLPQGALVAHVGDSRVYRMRGWQLEQMTFDHSLVWEMSSAHKIPEHEVPDYVPKNIITRSLGPSHEVQVDMEGFFPLEVGDTFLLCSDGLTGPVSDEEIGTILGCMYMEEAVRTLVDLANVRGGPDNITVVVVKVTGPQKANRNSNPTEKTPLPQPQPVHPLLWALSGVFALVTLGAAAMGAWFPAFCGLGATLITSGVALARRYMGPEIVSVFEGQPLGKAPYTSINCTPSRHFVERLGKTVSQLREAVTQEKWTLKWHRFDELIVQAAKASDEPDYKEAVRSYCLALSFIMDQLRQQNSGEEEPAAQ